MGELREMGYDGNNATNTAPRGTGGAGRRHRRPRAGSRARRIAGAIALVAAVCAGGLGIAYAQLNGNLRSVDIAGALGKDRPDNVDNGSQDILVLGSDSRAGENGKYGRDEGSARSDTAMIVHIRGDRRKAAVVSIPRDTLVDRPICTTRTGGTIPAARRTMFNEAYAVGGPACAVKTVESMTGIRMDHYVEIDFSGFQKLIDKLGGVEVTTAKNIQDKRSHLDLAAGTHLLTGEQSLALVRTRHGVGDGSDLGRIKLQQAFVKALFGRVRSLGLLGNPAKLYGIADVATRVVTTDSDLASIDKLIGFANSLTSLDARGLEAMTLPVTLDSKDPNRVVPLAGAAQLWNALHDDKPVPSSAFRGSIATTTQADGAVK